MDVLMACSEVAPIVKVGALADAVSALCKTLSRLETKVTIALPRYRALESHGLMMARRLTPLRFSAGDEKIEAMVYDARLGSGVELILIEIAGLFDRDDVYGHDDDAKRYGLFSRAVAELVRSRGGFDAVHAHDWQTALIPHLLKGVADRPKTVLTVHDAAKHGRFPKAAIDDIGLSWDDFTTDALEYYGDLNMLKGGVLAADVVTTVSRTYGRELAEPSGGSGLDGVFRARDIIGILNGIDYATWSPATDPHIAARYDAEDASNKGRCKAALLHELDLSIEPGRPLLVSLGPVSEDKGSDILAEALNQIVRTHARVVIAGDGDRQLMALLEDAAASTGDDAIFLGAVTDPMAHRLMAAADAVLMPSRFEPCGLVQQYAQRYGALPIVSDVGGLRDTVVDSDAQCETGTGFVFDPGSAEAVVGAVQRAASAMKTPAWGRLRRRVMRLDRSWERPARRYARLYGE